MSSHEKENTIASSVLGEGTLQINGRDTQQLVATAHVSISNFSIRDANKLHLASALTITNTLSIYVGTLELNYVLVVAKSVELYNDATILEHETGLLRILHTQVYASTTSGLPNILQQKTSGLCLNIETINHSLHVKAKPVCGYVLSYIKKPTYLVEYPPPQPDIHINT